MTEVSAKSPGRSPRDEGRAKFSAACEMRDARLARGGTSLRAGRRAKQPFPPNQRNRVTKVCFTWSSSTSKTRLRSIGVCGEKGRMMPDGLEYVSSWIDADLKVCWQLMRTEDESLLRVWTDNWKDLMDFEVVPVRTSTEVREMMEKQR